MKNDFANLIVFIAFKTIQYTALFLAVIVFIYGIVNTFFLQ
jgi:hypothetical protein